MFYVKLIAGALTTTLLWSLIALVGAFYGWWLEPIAPPGDARSFMDAATELIDEQNHGNTAFVLIEQGEVFAEYYASAGDDLDRNTLFATASMSKWVTAVCVLKLVEDGSVNLDAPVSAYLSRWQLPSSEYNNEAVTVRNLLSHTSGLTDGLGFGDYETDEAIPTLEESLNHPRASSDRAVAIALGNVPGTEFQYSGGGYLILQLLIEEVSGGTFEEFVQQTVFQPLGMSRSTYEYLGTLENVSRSYDANGEPAPTYRYAVAAATGFSTSVADMVRFIQAQLPGDNDVRAVDQSTIEQMRTPHASMFGLDIWGLGTILYAPTRNGDFVFGHDGSNEPAINSAARINPESGDAIVVLVSGHVSLATTIGSHWVAWQTGLPDALASGATAESALIPIAIGTGVVAIFFLVIGWRLRAD